MQVKNWIIEYTVALRRGFFFVVVAQFAMWERDAQRHRLAIPRVADAHNR